MAISSQKALRNTASAFLCPSFVVKRISPCPDLACDGVGGVGEQLLGGKGDEGLERSEDDQEEGQAEKGEPPLPSRRRGGRRRRPSRPFIGLRRTGAS
jgi:hypothetical protein